MKYIAQELGKSARVNFEVVHVWCYGYLLRRLMGIDERGMLRTCPMCRVLGNHEGITRGLFKCHRHDVVFNADLVGVINILTRRKTITPSPTLSGIGVTRPRPARD